MVPKKKNDISRLDLLILAFWFRKDEQWSINKKKTNPTPKSMTHKKPIKMSPSSQSCQRPKKIRYKPAKYHNVSKLYVEMKKIKVINIKVCKINTSFKILVVLKTQKGPQLNEMLVC